MSSPAASCGGFVTLSLAVGKNMVKARNHGFYRNPLDEHPLWAAEAAGASWAGSSHRYAVFDMLEAMERFETGWPGVPAMLLAQRPVTARAAAIWSRCARMFAM